VHIQDLQPPRLVGPVDQDLPIKAAGAQQGRVEDFRTVGCRQQHQARCRVEAVHLHQQLVECLFLLVVPADIGAARAAERIEFVDEDDRRRLLPRLFEQVAHAGGADADEHLDEFRAADREERHARLAGHRARQQGLASARRSHQQHTLGRACAEPAIDLRLLEEVDDFLQFLLRFIDAGDVVEAGFHVGFDIDLRLALANGHEPTAEATLVGETSHQEHPDAEEHDRGENPAEKIPEKGVLHDAGKAHVVLGEVASKVRLDPGGHEVRAAILQWLAQLAPDVVRVNSNFLHVTRLQFRHELAVRQGLDRLHEYPHIPQQQDAEQRKAEVPKIESGLFFHHVRSRQWAAG